MSKYIKSFNDATSMRAYLDTAEGMKYYLLKNEAGEDGIGATPESGKKIVSLFKGRDYLTFTAQRVNSTVKFNNNYWSSVEYSVDGGTNWVNAQNVTVTLANVGDNVKYRGVVIDGDFNKGKAFTMTGKIAASGSIMSMNNNNPNDTVISKTFAYYFMFSNCTSLTTPPELPATTLAESCYRGMFSNCTSLTTPPELPATTRASDCYREMFNGCNSLTTGPEIYLSSISGTDIINMFNNCSSLNYVKIHVLNWQNEFDWLSGVAATGIVECPVGCTIPSDSTQGVPEGWTKVEF